MIKYLHVINLDKFTKGFVSFIIHNFNSSEHGFIIYGDFEKSIFKFDLSDSNNIIYLDSHKNLKKNDKIVTWFKESKLIIINGAFGGERCLVHFPSSYLKKTYIMFWGGDFYYMNKKIPFYKLKTRLSNELKKYMIKNSGGVINLIPQDYDKLCNIVIPKGKSFIAPMGDNGESFEILKKYSNTVKSVNPYKILLGNSATETNQHIEAMEILHKFKDENIEIVCPLSYGDKQYAEIVIKKGKELFGDKFKPITDYIEKDTYYKILSEIKVAVFNNNRQQAMGNINSLFMLGCKQYIRDDTSMWNFFKFERKYNVFNINDIKNISFDDFIEFPDDISEQNKKIRIESADKNLKIVPWQKIFDSVE